MSSSEIPALDVQQIVGILAGAAWGNCAVFEALLDEGPGLSFVDSVEALDDAGLDCPAAVEAMLELAKCPQAGVSDTEVVVEPLAAPVLVLGEVVVRLWPLRGVGCQGRVVTVSSSLTRPQLRQQAGHAAAAVDGFDEIVEGSRVDAGGVHLDLCSPFRRQIRSTVCGLPSTRRV